MGLPSILISFKAAGTSAIARSARGIVAMILKDSTDITFSERVYSSSDEINANEWSATSLAYINLAFLGSPSKVIVERLATDAVNYSTALAVLKNKKWNYLTIPGIVAGDVPTISAWIISQRETYYKTFKAVLPDSASDHEGIINFTTDGNVYGTTTYDNIAYCARIAGILAGLSLSRSATYYGLTELTSCTEVADPDTDIDAGKLILIGDTDSAPKIARGVNSLTTTGVKGTAFRKIKIVEGVDLIRDDIHDTFDGDYVGQVINSYDNKILFLAAVNAYFGELERLDVLDPSYDNKAMIDEAATRLYITGKGDDPSTMSSQEIKEYNTGSTVYATANVKFLDAMEDMTFVINM